MKRKIKTYLPQRRRELFQLDEQPTNDRDAESSGNRVDDKVAQRRTDTIRGEKPPPVLPFPPHELARFE